jgi:cysteinyl-tRNA synthetase
MAKSAGNIERIADVAGRGIDPLAFRYLCLTSRYRHKLEYTDESLAAAAAGLGSLRAGLAALGPAPGEGPWSAPVALRAGAAADRPIGTVESTAGNGDGSAGDLSERAHSPGVPLSDAGLALHGRFVAALDDDLDLPTALAVVRETLRADLPPDERRWLVLDADFVLGLDLDRAVAAAVPGDAADVPSQIAALVAKRAEARAARDFATSDRLRDQLAASGYRVIDGPDGQTLERSPRGSP